MNLNGYDRGCIFIAIKFIHGEEIKTAEQWNSALDLFVVLRLIQLANVPYFHL